MASSVVRSSWSMMLSSSVIRITSVSVIILQPKVSNKKDFIERLFE